MMETMIEKPDHIKILATVAAKTFKVHPMNSTMSRTGTPSAPRCLISDTKT